MTLGSEFQVVLEVFQPLVRRGSKRLNSGISGWISGKKRLSLAAQDRFGMGLLSPDELSPLLLMNSPLFSSGFWLLKFWLLAGLAVAN